LFSLLPDDEPHFRNRLLTIAATGWSGPLG